MQSKLPIAVLCGVLLMALAACGGSGDGARITELEADLVAEQEARELAEDQAAEAEEKRQAEETARLEAEAEAQQAAEAEQRPRSRRQMRMTPPKPSGCGWKRRKRVRPPKRSAVAAGAAGEGETARARRLIRSAASLGSGTLDARGQGSANTWN